MKMGFLLDIVFGDSHGKPTPFTIGSGKVGADSFEISLKTGASLDSQYTINDLPSYQTLVPLGELADLKRLASPLYQGYLIDLSLYGTLDEYIRVHFPTTKRMFRRQADKLRIKVGPKQKIFHGAPIEEGELDLLFESFEDFLEKRFQQMEAHNYELPFLPQYKTMFRTLVPKGEAIIFSQYHHDRPIALGIGFLNGGTLYLFNIAFDIDYSPYGLGNQMLLDVLEWCYKNGIYRVDMGRGDYFHKRKWVNASYTYRELSLYKAFTFSAIKAYFTWAKNGSRYHLIALLKKMGMQTWAKKFFKWKYRHWGPGSKEKNLQKETNTK